MPEIRKGATSLFIAEVFVNVFNYLALVYFARLLGAEVLGTYYLFLTVVSLSVFFSGIGLHSAITKRLSEHREDEDKVFGASVLIQIVFLLITITVVIAIRDYITAYLKTDLIMYVVLAILFIRLNKYMVSLLRGIRKIKRIALVRIITSIAIAGISVSLVFFFNMGLIGLVLGYMLGYMVGIMVALGHVDISLRTPDLSNIKNIMSFAKYSGSLGFSGLIYNWSDTLIIGLLLTHADVGVYEMAWRIGVFVGLASQSISETIMPEISNLDSKNLRKKISQIVGKGAVFTTLIPVGALFGGILLSEEIMGIFGDEFKVAAPILIVFLIGKIFYAQRRLFDSFLGGIDKPHLTLRVRVFTMFLNVSLNVVLIYKIGLIGAAIATTASEIFDVVFLMRYSRRYIKAEYIPWKEISWIFGSAAVMCSVIFVFKYLMYPLGIIELVLLLILGTAVYSVFILRHETLRKDILELLPPSLTPDLLK